MSIDLHCHSIVSDGALTPAEIVQRAQVNGCTLLALTDHDHTGGVAAARLQATQSGITLINGVEVSVSWRGRTIHIVGLNIALEDERLQTLLQRLRSGRLQRLQSIAEKLSKKGISGAYEGTLALATNIDMVTRTHIADFLVNTGHVNKKADAFRKYLGDGKSCSVKHQWAELTEAVAAIRHAGGIAVIAHPMRYDLSATARRNLFSDFKACGGTAIEVHSGCSSLNDRLNYALLAQQFGFLASCGSDFHRDGDFGGGLIGCCPPLPPICQPVWTDFS
ncbi:phosphatase [Snodgrassella communis]|uniref:Metal-dependent phosphoesterase, PHP family n=1 Tax=Snodgrassella communis TaxID=2946699 RepID=A0A066TIA7_9NEIS|nr:PHP domain-containing protein [Snodgrassella communis]KDN12401.1 metal-dependent phosphoesterase, PHP family [Snodgrassella communis]KDN14861.1 metal-dependent phosphoesterase, PHP family [Snodgrassella communis]PIT08702.1 phosphatase [Snodgrassella communis]PIT29336.1 phosphatase [Snodgrassella communis]PIT29542.1 phosphatase [Snodgrassella communis]